MIQQQIITPISKKVFIPKLESMKSLLWKLPISKPQPQALWEKFEHEESVNSLCIKGMHNLISCLDSYLDEKTNISESDDIYLKIYATGTLSNGEIVYAPGTVIISAAGEVSDIRQTVSPALQAREGTKLIYVNLSKDKFSLGGSSLAQILNLLNDLKSELQFTTIFISHDLGVVHYISNRIMVMNKGKIEETGSADEIYNDPKSQYTRKLIASIPKMNF